MNDALNLIIIYALFMIFNTIISLTLWIKHKDRLFKYLVLLWSTAFLNFFMQGVFSTGTLPIAYASGVGFLEGLVILKLISELSDLKFRYSPFIIFQILCYAISTVIYFTKGDVFFLVALPISIGVVAPMFYSTFQLLIKRWNEISYSLKGFAFSCIALGLHQLDFPFLRPNPNMVEIGFGIAMVIIFSLSVFAPSVITEFITKEKSHLDAEVGMAKQIQHEILPKEIKIKGLEIATYMESADEVGGDYYDVLHDKEKSWIVLGDVTGHGVGSGLVMFMVQSIMSSVLETVANVTPKKLNYLANQILSRNLKRLHEQRSMTVATIATSDGRNFTVSGNHDDAYIFRQKTKEVEILTLDQLVVGIGMDEDLDEELFSETTFKLEKDDILLLSTDGITEAAVDGDPNNELFGEERVISFLKEIPEDNTPDKLKEALLEKIAAFTNETYYDDLTFLIIKAV